MTEHDHHIAVRQVITDLPFPNLYFMFKPIEQRCNRLTALVLSGEGNRRQSVDLHIDIVRQRIQENSHISLGHGLIGLRVIQ